MDVCESQFCDTNKLERLQALIFASEKAESDNRFYTPEVTQRLLGFLEARSETCEDAAYLANLKQQALSQLKKARGDGPILDIRSVLESAGVSDSFRFGVKGALDLTSLRECEPFGTILRNAETLHSKKQVRQSKTPSPVPDQKAPAPRPASETALPTTVPDRIYRQPKLPALYTPSATRQTSFSAPQPATSSKPESSQLKVQNVSSYAGLSKQKPQSLWARVATKSEPAEDDDDDLETARRKRSRLQDTPSPPEGPSMKQTKRRRSGDDDEIEDPGPADFMSAKQKLVIENAKKGLQNTYNRSTTQAQQGIKPKRGARGAFIPPYKSTGGTAMRKPDRGGEPGGDEENEAIQKLLETLCGPDGELPDKIKNIEPRLLEQISNEIIDQAPNVTWDDIAGLGHAKKSIQELVVWPLKRPDLFAGVRSPGKGLLLFGPPGTGKTLLGKAIAAEADATFFSLSASSLTSKWIGEGEKLVRALFGVASCRQPAVIFIDEVDSLLSQRKSEGEHESSRRLKTEFLVQMEGCCNTSEERVLFIGATNRPQELDEAARRRLSKRLYIPLPTAGARTAIVQNLLAKDGLMTLSDEDLEVIQEKTKGYSGSDVKNLVKEAALGPVREAAMQGNIDTVERDQMRPITLQDFESALHQVRASVSPSELLAYQDWNKQFGSLAVGEQEAEIS